MSTPALADPSLIVERVGELPTLPAIYAKIAEMATQPDTSADDLERIIAHDQALAGKLLKLVNSAFYGFPVEIRTIDRAVMIVGFQALAQLALSASVLNLIPVPDSEEEEFDYKAFWTHSIGVAVTSRRLVMEVGGAPPRRRSWRASSTTSASSSTRGSSRRSSRRSGARRGRRTPTCSRPSARCWASTTRTPGTRSSGSGTCRPISRPSSRTTTCRPASRRSIP
jgi:hypothetical protein